MIDITTPSLATDITAVAQAADSAVSGASVLAVDRAAEPGWTVVTRADGLRVRLDGVGADSPAVQAVLNLDLSPQAIAARAQAALEAAASKSLLVRDDVTAIQVRALITAVVFLINNRLEALGQPRVLEVEIFRQLAAQQQQEAAL